MLPARRLAAGVLVTLLVTASVLAGCIGADDPAGDDDALSPGNATDRADNASRGGNATTNVTGDPEPSPGDNTTDPPDDVNATPAPRAGDPVVTIAVIDTGINPYHTEFRDASALAQQHPATYIPGYPRDAQPLRLTLDAPDLETALERDRETWQNVDPDTLYWVPGTRVVGLRSFILDGELPGFDENGHGTMTASRAAGATTSLAPEARIVALEGLSEAGVAWAASQSWIDVQTNSWGYPVVIPLSGTTFADAGQAMPVFAASGNGAAQQFGAVGQPAVTGDPQGNPHVITVGGHDNGRVILWPGSLPHLVADACFNWAADASTLDRTAPDVGTGTSSSAPYAAGAAARLVLEAKRLLADATPRTSGVLAQAGAGARATQPAEGPLADGELALDELRAVLYRTAIPRPAATEHDGTVCGPEMETFTSPPVPYDAVPEDVPLYYLVGYGAINVHSLDHALQVLRGDAPIPERPTEDTVFGLDHAVRRMVP